LDVGSVDQVAVGIAPAHRRWYVAVAGWRLYAGRWQIGSDQLMYEIVRWSGRRRWIGARRWHSGGFAGDRLRRTRGSRHALAVLLHSLAGPCIGSGRAVARLVADSGTGGHAPRATVGTCTDIGLSDMRGAGRAARLEARHARAME
jgi:hypothetical protein